MPAGDDEKTKRLLEESVQQIARLPAGQPEGGVSAFNSFRTGVSRANGHGANTDELLGPLEPKVHVLEFLLALHEKKKMYRKQIEDVFSKLVQVDGWRLSLRVNETLYNRLPDELRDVLEAVPVPAFIPEAEPEPAAAAAPAAALPLAEPSGVGALAVASGAGVLAAERREDDVAKPDSVPLRTEECEENCTPSDSAVRAAIAAAKARIDGTQDTEDLLPVVVPACALATSVAGSAAVMGSLSVGLELLSNARSQIEALGYSAGDVDAALSAFEQLYKGIIKIVRSPSKSDDEVLEKLEPKDRILRFVLDFHGRKRLYHSRVVEVLTKLLDFEGWRAVAEAESSMEAAVRSILDRRDGPGAATLGAPSSRCPVAKTAPLGAAGVLEVRIIAAYSLMQKDIGLPDPYVSVAVGGSVKRTEVVNNSLNPRWDAGPMAVEVPSMSSTVNLEVLDRDLSRDTFLGSIKLSIQQIPTQPGQAIRRRLEGVKQGELELELLFRPGEGSCAAPAATTPAAAPAFAPPRRRHPWEGLDRVAGTDGAPRAGAGGDVPAPPPASPRWAAWVSVEPRNGALRLYPQEIARKLEHAQREGQNSLNLGHAFFEAVVHFTPKLVQRTARGSRDVRRVELSRPDDLVVLFVAKGNDWRATERGAEGAEERVVTASKSDTVELMAA